MTKAKLIKEIEQLCANQKIMEERLRELEQASKIKSYFDMPAPAEATDDELFYILRTRGYEAYHQALKNRNRQRAKRWGMDRRLRRAA